MLIFMEKTDFHVNMLIFLPKYWFTETFSFAVLLWSLSVRCFIISIFEAFYFNSGNYRVRGRHRKAKRIWQRSLQSLGKQYRSFGPGHAPPSLDSLLQRLVGDAWMSPGCRWPYCEFYSELYFSKQKANYAQDLSLSLQTKNMSTCWSTALGPHDLHTMRVVY